MNRLISSTSRIVLYGSRRALKIKEIKGNYLATMADIQKQDLDDPGGRRNTNRKQNDVSSTSATVSSLPMETGSSKDAATAEKSDAECNSSAQPDHFKSVKVRRVSMPMVLYRRPLPESCIAFASDEGKEIFKEALLSGHMVCYFRLAAQFRTQDEPAYCGLATLVMVLNALEIDPGRVWKGPWKWYHEDMLDCCIPTQLIRQQGVTFDEFICLADCNYLDTQAVRVDQSSTEEDFRKLVKDITLKEDTFLICSYSRQVLGQTGDGHFAPVSGYHPEKDLVLILDTARFKYPPHWIPLSSLFDSMKALDESTGLPRGYVQVRAAKNSKSLLLFKIAEQLSVNADPEVSENCQRFLSAWKQLLASPVKETDAADASLVRQTLQGLVSMSRTLGLKTHLLSTQEHVSCTNACNVQCVVQELLTELGATSLFRLVCEEVLKLPAEDLNTLESIFGIWKNDMDKAEGLTDGQSKKSLCCDMTKSLCLSHFVTAFLFSWPYYPLSQSPSTLASKLLALSQTEQGQLKGHFLRDEISTLNRQMKRLRGFHSHTEESQCPSDKQCCAKKSPSQGVDSKDSERSPSEQSSCCSKSK